MRKSYVIRFVSLIAVVTAIASFLLAPTPSAAQDYTCASACSSGLSVDPTSPEVRWRWREFWKEVNFRFTGDSWTSSADHSYQVWVADPTCTTTFDATTGVTVLNENGEFVTYYDLSYNFDTVNGPQWGLTPQEDQVYGICSGSVTVAEPQ